MEYLIQGILTLIGTLAGYVWGSRKNNAEADTLIIKNVKDILEVYSGTIQDLKKEISELKDKIDGYEKQIECLNRELTEFRNEMKKPV
jgi:predicted RNase H-like nuclease (RuvC/YqgF family)